jgi:hypothetical protein
MPPSAGMKWMAIRSELQFPKSGQYKFSFFDNSVSPGHNSSPFSIDRRLHWLVPAARNLVQERLFCHRVVVVNLSSTQLFGLHGLDGTGFVRWAAIEAFNKKLSCTLRSSQHVA